MMIIATVATPAYSKMFSGWDGWVGVSSKFTVVVSPAITMMLVLEELSYPVADAVTV
jgi:hypothetical protein